MIHTGDCLEVLKTLAPDSMDSLVTDPPAGIAFMGKEWDKDKGGRDAWVKWMSEVMCECLRVLKPGAHALVWAIPRTSHWTTTACEDAGFEIRDVITHLFGSGFPKSLDISKAIDKAAGAEREVVGPGNDKNRGRHFDSEEKTKPTFITAPSTDAAKLWQGWGTALKPASEHWVLCRKPLREKTVAANVLKWGCGGINIDASRIGTEVVKSKDSLRKEHDEFGTFIEKGGTPRSIGSGANHTQGRFPANLVLSHNEDCVEVGVKKVKPGNGSGYRPDPSKTSEQHSMFGVTAGTTSYVSEDGTETVAAFECTPGCAVAELDRQSGFLTSGGGNKSRKGDTSQSNCFGTYKSPPPDVRIVDSGGASRFFYCAKASKRERNEGCEGLPEKLSKTMNERDPDSSGYSHNTTGQKPALHQNHHPTVKPIKLMTYLIRMITRPGGCVLDPFLGSGSTGVAAIEAGFKFVGIEREKEYVQIAEKRIFHKFPEFKKDI